MAQAVGRSKDLLAVKLDITSRADAEAAVRPARRKIEKIAAGFSRLTLAPRLASTFIV